MEKGRIVYNYLGIYKMSDGSCYDGEFINDNFHGFVIQK